MTHHSFAALGLCDPILAALRAKSYSTPTPIQVRAIPVLLAGRDLLAVAQTGTGKTAAFALPILHRLAAHPRRHYPRSPRVLVLTPTRELAAQVHDSFASYGRNLRLRHAVVFGGVGMNPQIEALRGGVDVLVATPGRLLDLAGQGQADLRHVEVFVLDEADRMLDMGFLPDVRRLIALLPRQRHTMLFSATMPADIVQLAASILHAPQRIEVAPPATTVERVEQFVYFVDKASKRRLLVEILRSPSIERALVFTRTKHGADRVSKDLHRQGIEAEAIHGNKRQTARERALEGFREGDVRVLVATDIAARGLDVRDISHVINFDLPNVPESYVHRIGRTARAGREGIAISFCDAGEQDYLRAIEKLTRRRIAVLACPALPRAAPLAVPGSRAPAPALRSHAPDARPQRHRHRTPRQRFGHQ
jgi:ATP-dependent RNA helicase RhlE